ncbi:MULTISPECIES: ArsR/SmtB family transcription factor [unclassified Kribbella]|uniref:ArsR/SmtB family transcription factor n=1 Tax=unclassified Kribbella TaxID=2644121 RepID=UPI00301991C4
MNRSLEKPARSGKDIAANAVICPVAVTLLLPAPALSPDPSPITVRTSPLAELCACLHALDEPDHHPAAARWVARVHAGADEDLLSRATAWAPLWSAFRARYLLPLTPGPRRTLEEELQDIEAIPIDDFVTMTLQALIGKNNAAIGDDVLHRLRLISSSRLELGSRVRADPDGFRTSLLDFLTDFAAAAFTPEWPAMKAVLDREATAREHTLHRRGPLALADLPAATALDGRIVLDKLYNATVQIDAHRPCLLVPTLYGQPHFVVKHYPGYPVVIQYGMSPSTAPSLETIRHRLAVLQDPTRLRLCYAILRNPVATSELANQLGMSAPQVSRHLRKLREAELVHVHRRGSVVYYQLDAAAIERLGPQLLSVLYR